MRALFRTSCFLAIIAAYPGAAAAQELRTTFGTDGGLQQSTSIEDPFQEPRVPVTAPAFQNTVQQRQQAAQQRASTQGSQTTRTSRTTASQRSAFDRGADLDPPDPLANSALSYSGGDSIAQSAQDRARLSQLAATGNLPPIPQEGPVRQPTVQAGADAGQGIRRGNFILSPEIEIGGVYTSNVNSASRDGPDDFGMRLAPRLALRSDWARHAIAFDFNGEHVFYDKFDEQNVNNFSAAVSGRVDIRSTTTLDVSAGFGQSQSNSADFEVPDTAQGTRNDRAYNVTARLTHAMNRIITQATASATWFQFGNVDLGLGEELNADRDYVTPAVGLRVGYQVSEALQPFTEVTYSPRIHDVTVDRNGLRRDSHGVVVRAGVTFNDGAVWAGEVAGRYEYRTYDDATLSDQHAFGVDANVTWNVSELTAVSFTANSQIEETSDPGAAGATTWTAGTQISHQFRDNIAGEAGVSVGYTDFDGVSDEFVIGTSLGLAYAIHPHIELIAGYEFTTQDPGEAGGYEEHRVSSGMRFRL